MKGNLSVRRGAGTLSCIGAIFLAGLSACGGTSATATTAPATATPVTAPTAILNEMSVTVSPTFKAGTYTFTITNAGSLPHELLVFKSDLDVAQYPRKNGAIDEEGAGIVKVSDGDNLAPGGVQTRAIDLSKPGKYLFVCNLPGHFSSGMYATVTVSAA